MKGALIHLFRIAVPTEKSKYELGELAKEFINSDGFSLELYDPDEEYDLVIPDLETKFERGRVLYDFLSNKLSKKQDWGILVGVRPKKLYSELTKKNGMKEAERILSQEYCLNDTKIKLLRDTYLAQEKALAGSEPNAIGIYVGIPFCPTRCLYCSFTSNKITKQAASNYLVALKKEIKAVERILKERGLFVESIYIGGGTPTSLDDEDFNSLLDDVSSSFMNSKTKEFTVECGRPDTINQYKLNSLLKHGVDRISINPQTMSQKTLDIIGRAHSPEDIINSFKLARATGDFIINMDLITGLPEENPDDFKNTLDTIIDLNPENITVHTLAVKKASRLIEQDNEFNYRQADTVREMLSYASSKLYENKYVPYYLYRQKHMAGNFENVGYCKEGYAGIYNIRIMEENQSIIALGAGGISKIFYPEENRIERIPNVSNYEIYIERIDEMIKRKEEGIK